MCTTPNYIRYAGTDFVGRPKYDFLGHHEYSRIKNNLKDLFVSVPCGKCMECRIQYSRAWADRCTLEARNSPYNYFVTLTFDDYHLSSDSVHIKDIQLFMKRLRNRFPDYKIKYFACGEYGSKDLRPHYHLILFNCPLDDLVYQEFKSLDPLSGKDRVKYVGGLDYQFSQTIYECWHKKGFITVAPFCYQTASYVAQYCTKKIDGTLKSRYKEVGIEPEFLTMSQGLGSSSYDDDVVFSDLILVERNGSTSKSHTPRYFDKLFKKKYGDDVFAKTIGKNRAFARFKKRSRPDDIHSDLQRQAREHHMKDKLSKERGLKDL